VIENKYSNIPKKTPCKISVESPPTTVDQV